MSTTPNLTLAYIASSQAQKEVTHNAALNDLDFLAKTSAIDHTISTPPAAPNTGDAYIIGPAPTGAWSGFGQCHRGVLRRLEHQAAGGRLDRFHAQR